MAYSFTKKDILRAFGIAVLLILLFTALSTAQAHAKAVQVHKKDTHTVIVGNSRVVDLWNSGYRTYSLIARSGGQYSTNDFQTIPSKSYGADSFEATSLKKSRYTAIMNSIKAGLKKKHKCRVVIFATINECRNDRVEVEGKTPDEVLDRAGQKLIKFAKKCRIRVKVKTTKKERAKQVKQGKKPTKYIYVRAKVYVMQCVGAADYEWGLNYKKKYIRKYNKYVKKYCKENNMDFVTFDREPKMSEFREDGLHFKIAKSGYNAHMWKKLKSLEFRPAV